MWGVVWHAGAYGAKAVGQMLVTRLGGDAALELCTCPHDGAKGCGAGCGWRVVGVWLPGGRRYGAGRLGQRRATSAAVLPGAPPLRRCARVVVVRHGGGGARGGRVPRCTARYSTV